MTQKKQAERAGLCGVIAPAYALPAIRQKPRCAEADRVGAVLGRRCLYAAADKLIHQHRSIQIAPPTAPPMILGISRARATSHGVLDASMLAPGYSRPGSCVIPLRRGLIAAGVRINRTQRSLCLGLPSHRARSQLVGLLRCSVARPSRGAY